MEQLDSIVVAWNAEPVTTTDGRRHFRVAFVTLAEEILPRDTARYYKVSAISEEHSSVRQYLEKIHTIAIKPTFHTKIWGDTTKTDARGNIVSVPNLASHVRLYFQVPVSEGQLDSLKKHPEIFEAAGMRGFFILPQEDLEDQFFDPMDLSPLK